MHENILMKSHNYVIHGKLPVSKGEYCQDMERGSSCNLKKQEGPVTAKSGTGECNNMQMVLYEKEMNVEKTCDGSMGVTSRQRWKFKSFV